MNQLERFEGCLLGLACGDAVGTTVEFKPRGSFRPVTDMTGGGPFGLKRGQWTDDTSMALCIATSLVEHRRFDARDIMQRFCRWMDDGYLSSNGTCFDIGGTVSDALYRYKDTGDVYAGAEDRYSAGNGCLMRLAPIPMFFHADAAAAMQKSALSSRLTHGAQECIDATRLFAALLVSALGGVTKEEILSCPHLTIDLCASVKAIADGSYRRKDEDDIRGSGYVIDSLEAALWCFANTSSFEEAILRAANLGQDADTTAAICGQIAGAFYGVGGIPEHWLEHLAMRDDIRSLAAALALGPDRH
ncbi:ADP-ribosylglycohydrolase family protein [Paraburkholderia diazotrophica]|uniref:ADP-ribosyl-[dinitrogen reductase] hydrolase n=1 Tax=Paraburkholderia diazotrophica TaxID=667676 RepID=A0A1H7CRN7_9BURK|nr:ADP-ribosylglycohydrolase family protein [Paraburkholderia diazotrophica]SEJ91217.1 ADP-ribosyl-[dinitrogen reductase] hydrolase [Paraburkholderia diazotrophica]